MVTLRRPSFSRAVFTGSAAATAYLLAQAVDRHVVPSGYDDLVLWEGFFRAGEAGSVCSALGPTTLWA